MRPNCSLTLLKVHTTLSDEPESLTPSRMNFIKKSIAMLLALLIASPVYCCMFIGSDSSDNGGDALSCCCERLVETDAPPEDSEEKGHQCACFQDNKSLANTRVTPPQVKLVSLIHSDQSRHFPLGNVSRFEKGHWPKLSARPPDWVDRSLNCVFLI